MKYLDGYLNIINTIQRQSLEHFIGSAAPAVASLSGAPAFRPYYVDKSMAKKYLEPLDSISYNNMQTTLSADMSTLYSHANYVDILLRRGRENSVKDIQKINNNIDITYRALERKQFAITRNMLGFKGIYYNSFRDASDMLSPNDPLYDGSDNIISIDERNHRATVPTNNIFNYTSDLNNYSVIDIEVLDRRGATIGPVNALYPVDLAVDTSDDTYWAEMIMADEPLKNTFAFRGNTYDVTKNSAAIALKIELKGIKFINEIRIKPFCEYPMYISGIYAVNTINEVDIVTRHILSTQQGSTFYIHPPQYIEDTRSFFFAPVAATSIVIIFTQPHYRKTSFRLPKGKRENYEIFNTIFASSTAFGTIDYSKFKTDKDLMTTSNNIAHSMVRELEPEISWINRKSNVYEKYSKFEYVLGAYDIGFKYNEYKDSAVFISKPIKTKAAIGQISLWVDSAAVNEYGTIEYSLLLGETNVEVPIMPINEELLYEYIPEDGLVGTKHYLRFRQGFLAGYALLYLIGRESVEKINRGITWDSVTNSNYIDLYGVDYTNKIMVLRYPYDPVNEEHIPPIKMVNGYHPQYIDTLHDFINSPITAVEETIESFNEDEYSITLKNIPFVEYNKLMSIEYNAHGDYNADAYVPIVMTIQNTNIEYFNTISDQIDITTTVFQFVDNISTLSRPYTFNKTDYKTKGYTYLQSYEGVGVNPDNTITTGDNYLIEYSVLGNKVFFNTNLSGSTFNIRYYKLSDIIKLKAKIISTIPGRIDAPPFINSYALLINYANNISTFESDTEEYGSGNIGTGLSTGCDFSIRQDYSAGSYSDDYTEMAIVLINDNNHLAPTTTRRFKIYNTGIVASRYKLFFRATSHSHNDSNNDMKWLLNVVGMDLEQILYASLTGSGVEAESSAAYWDATETGYPSNIEWLELELGNKYIQPGANDFFDISIKPISSGSTCKLTETRLMIEFYLEALDDQGAIGIDGLIHKCKRSGPSYFISIRGTL